MKIIQINAVYGISSTGTIVKDIHNLCEANGISSYIAYSLGSNHYKQVLNSYKIGSYVSKKLHAILSRISGKQAYYSRISTWLLIRWIQYVQPDIVHLHNLHSNYINLNSLLKYLAKTKIPTVITMHDCWYFTGGCFHYTSVRCDKWKSTCGSCPKRYQDTPAYIYDSSSTILKDRVRYLSQISNLVFVGCSNWILKQLQESRLREVGKNLCIYNGFDLDVFRPIETDIKEKLRLNGYKLMIGPASKWLSIENNEALEYFIKNMPHRCVLLLFGYSGPKIKISENVHLYGYMSSPNEMAKLYSAADVLVNCSREDTLSSINIEAQACGTPTVAYDSTGNKETIDSLSGYAVETGDYKELFNSAIKILDFDKSSLSRMCRNYVKLNFDKDVNYQKYIDLYNSLLD